MPARRWSTVARDDQMAAAVARHAGPEDVTWDFVLSTMPTPNGPVMVAALLIMVDSPLVGGEPIAWVASVPISQFDKSLDDVVRAGVAMVLQARTGLLHQPGGTSGNGLAL